MPLICRNFTFDLTRPLVMGIVNATPDSFSDGGKYLHRDAALKQIESMIEQGADILDIGGESTRPGAEAVSLDEELSRVMPILEALQSCSVAISIDTHKPAVMTEAIRAGVSMVNDVNAFQTEGAWQAVAQHNVGICLMHKQGEPKNMQQAPAYDDLMLEISEFLQQGIKLAHTWGVESQRIVVDPGFGFGKTQRHNLQLLRQFKDFRSLGVSVLAGMSRKSMIGNIINKPPEQRVSASVSAALIAVQNGAHIVRVHDVSETVDALKVWCAVQEISY